MTTGKLCVVFTVVWYFVVSLSIIVDNYDYVDRTCDNPECFESIITAFGDCVLSDDKKQCSDPNDNDSIKKCKFIGNPSIRMCIDPSTIPEMKQKKLVQLLVQSSVSLGTNKLCLYDNEGNMMNQICTHSVFEGKCDKHSRKCLTPPKIRRKWEEKFLRKQGNLHELPYDYTNDLLIALDGTSTRSQFESKEVFENKKSVLYSLRDTAVVKNGNWANHISNFWEDYRGAKYYWYGPDAELDFTQAGVEVLAIVNSAHKVVCEFLTNHTNWEDVNVDIIGFSRGGYAAMELVQSLKIRKCEVGKEKIVKKNKKGKKKKVKLKAIEKRPKFRFLGLYDPVSSLNTNFIRGQPQTGLFNDKNHKYDAGSMPKGVGSIAISYGNPKLGSRRYFCQCDEDEGKNIDRKNIKKDYFISTHGGIGGTPGNKVADPGDFDEVLSAQNNPTLYDKYFKNLVYGIKDIKGYGLKMEKQESRKADMHIRKHAVEAKLPIHKTDEKYYNFKPDVIKNEKQDL